MTHPRPGRPRWHRTRPPHAAAVEQDRAIEGVAGMALAASWYVEVAVVGGHRISAGAQTTPEAVDFYRAEIQPGATENVDLLSLTAAGKVSLFVVRSTPLSDKVRLSFGDPAKALAGPFGLDGPLVLLGTGAVSMLPKPPARLEFTNGTADPVVVEVLVGRDATA